MASYISLNDIPVDEHDYDYEVLIFALFMLLGIIILFLSGEKI